MSAPAEPLPSLDSRRDRPREHTEGVRAMFDRIAPNYDLLNRLISGGLDQRWRRQAVDELRAAPAGARLDLCAGTLDFSALLSRTFPSERVVAVDVALEMMKRGRSKAPRVETVVADVCELPFDDGSFAAAVCGFGVRNVASPERFASEVLRVLAPGGVLVVLEAFRPARRLSRALHRLYVGSAFPALGALLSRDRAAYKYFAASVGEFLSRQEFQRLCERTGFSNVHGCDMTLGMAGIVVAQKGRS